MAGHVNSPERERRGKGGEEQGAQLTPVDCGEEEGGAMGKPQEGLGPCTLLCCLVSL
jgi:hypothetical protein